ncbi:Palmitoyltransferase pfa5 [Cytospora mali]|uniref:Palmitoyltransferase pfa5 n=1 Tax=Cytospora mali TaxID=578113 RepID=A0A194UZE0_CYTMA|nr:Palmitoyltransferase pfa5 [Valsa mali var. pyri (nom. inval.)]
MSTAFKFFVQFVTYTACYCVVCLSAGAYVTSRLAREGAAVSVPAIVLIAFAGFFGLFSFVMAARSHGFALSNMTNIEELSLKSKATTLAIRIPLDQVPNPGNSSKAIDYITTTFPLADDNFDGNQFIYDNQNTSANRHAEHKFAIVNTDVGDNPWDLGSRYKNWTSVMGDKGPVDWLLPLRLSPCCAHSGAYPFGPVVDRIRKQLEEEYE